MSKAARKSQGAPARRRRFERDAGEEDGAEGEEAEQEAEGRGLQGAEAQQEHDAGGARHPQPALLEHEIVAGVLLGAQREDGEGEESEIGRAHV